MTLRNEKDQVRDFWDQGSCGEHLYLNSLDQAGYRAQMRERYTLEPYIPEFADFESSRGLRVLEIGVGLGADHQMFAQAGAELAGIDLTERAIEHARRRLALFGLRSDLNVGDAENIAYPDASFDLVYSWGVIHHSPDTPKAAQEILRVLKPGGRFKIMIYHKYSFVGYMLWMRYGLAGLRPFMPLSQIYSTYLESPGTKAYTVTQAKALFSGAQDVKTWTILTHGDLLSSHAGQRHRGMALNIARRVWPRRLIRSCFPQHGLFLLIEGGKP